MPRNYKLMDKLEETRVEKKPKCELIRRKGENFVKSASVEENQEIEMHTRVRNTNTSAFSILMDPKLSKSKPNKLKPRSNPIKITSKAKMSSTPTKSQPSILRFLMIIFENLHCPPRDFRTTQPEQTFDLDLVSSISNTNVSDHLMSMTMSFDA